MNSAPDAYNRLQVQQVIDLYAQANPEGENSIGASILSAKEEQRELMLEQKLSQRTGVIRKNEAGRRLSFVMPSDLYIVLKKKFPTIFAGDKKKFEKDFPIFFKGWKP